MKSAKEWAAEWVVGPKCETGDMLTEIKDPQGNDEFDYVHLERETNTYSADEIANDARRLVQTLVERVQSDAMPVALLREFEALSEQMQVQLEEGVDDPVRVLERAMKLIRRLLNR
jgi:hypothetical protein